VDVGVVDDQIGGAVHRFSERAVRVDPAERPVDAGDGRAVADDLHGDVRERAEAAHLGRDDPDDPHLAPVQEALTRARAASREIPTSFASSWKLARPSRWSAATRAASVASST
jgi:hypothetical protein